MSNIKIHGLTAVQKELCDHIWSCDSQEDVIRFITQLPTELRQQAETVHELMIAAVFDQEMEVLPDVKDYIASL